MLLFNTRSCATWLCRILVFSSIGLLPQTAPVVGQTLQIPGGFIEKATDTGIRSLLSLLQIQALLPATRGLFTFPAPYNTKAIRLTNASDCGGSADCVNYVGYSYWRNMNNHVGSNEILIFIGLSKARGGVGPTLFSYNKTTDVVTKLGPLFDSSSIYSWHDGNGWYFSATQPTKLYISNNGRQLFRYDVLAKTFQTVFDISARFGTDKYIFQVHSSNDDLVHSFTLRQNGTFEMLGCAGYRENTQEFFYYPKIADFDECQIDKSGRWLLIKENLDGLFGEDNRIIDLQTGVERVQLDQNGAAGHSDNGYGYMVAADNYNPPFGYPNAVRLFVFGQDPLLAPWVHRNTSWAASVPAHISHANAKAAVQPSQQYACGSGASRTIIARANEIFCFRQDTSLDVLVVAPVMTNLDAPGGGDDYGKLPKGNLDVTGQYFIWTSNMGGSRLDAFLVKVPAQLLVGGQTDTTSPAAPTNLKAM